MALSNHETPLDPDWWLLRLGNRMRTRNKRLDFWKGYYKGDGQRLPQGPEAAGRVYRDFQKKSRTNFCMLPVEADVNRLLAIGIADGQGKSIDEAWKWWQRNKLDAKQKVVYRTALSLSESYVSVGEHPDIKREPLIVPEHPRQVITEDDPATGRRRAGLKAYYDDIEKCSRAFLDIDGEGVTVEYRTGEGAGRGGRLPWGSAAWTRVKDHPNPTSRVRFVSFSYRPDLEDDPEPVFARIIDIQDRINFTVLNRMTAERYSAFRQKWFTGGDIPEKFDEETGLEMPVNPWVPHPDSVMVHSGEHAKFGEFGQTDLLGYLKSNEADIRTAFVITSTPAYYMPGDMINVSTDAVMALDTNHVAKVGEEHGEFGESWEEVLQLAQLVTGFDDLDLSDAEMRWKDPRQLNPAVLADYGSKLKGMGYPLPMVAERMGESPAQVARLRTEEAAAQMRAAALARQPAQPQPNTPQFQAPTPSEAA